MAEEDVAQVKGDSRFKAFVSYSHADKAAAQKLHRKLEAYRLPKHLRGISNNGADGTASGDGRIGAIFRDREDLPAAEDLSKSVKIALSASEALVVLCSPDAQKSPWVAREIELFREIHPDRPVLAAILRGEPAEAFPEPLKQGREPLAADLRKEGDGPRLGFLKVVAGIAEVPLDALVNRDAQRRLRRVTAITVAAVAAMVVMALMTTFALQARDEAQTQQAEAEGLVEYMFTDLRGALKGVGRLDVMEGVNERAMQYYGAQGSIDGLADESLERRARILHAMGEDHEKLGDLEKAFSKFKEAHATTESLLSRDPANSDRIFAHAQSEYWVGYIAWEQRDDPLALAHWQAYRTLAGQLRDVEPKNARSYLELGYSEGNLCTYNLRDDRDPALAEDHCLRAITFLENGYAVAPESDEMATALANRLGWLAKHYAKRSRTQDALEYRGRERRLIEDLLSEDPENHELRMRMAWSLAGEAEQLSLLNKGQAAEDTISRSKSLGSELLRIEPDSLEYLTSNFRIFVKAAEIEKRIGKRDWSASANRAREIIAQIGRRDKAEVVELKQHIDRLNQLRGV